MSETSIALDRARLVERSLSAFLNACYEYLCIDGLRLDLMPYVRRRLQKFEGVPEVYPHAFALLDAIGPGSGREIEWPPIGWDVRFRARLEDVAQQARHLILGTWGWPAGLDPVHLRSLSRERRQTGMPTMQRQHAEMDWIIERMTPEDRDKAIMGFPPFRENVEPAKREQFDRIVKTYLDALSPLSRGPYGDPYWASDEFADQIKGGAFTRIDDLDRFEETVLQLAATLSDPMSGVPDLEVWEYQERPLIGSQAASLPFQTWRTLRDAHEALRRSIRGASRPDSPAEPVGINAKTETAPATGASRPTPSKQAIQCYRLKVIKGEEITQAGLAREVYGDSRKQWQVSRDLRDVKAWTEAGNILPDLEENKPKTYTSDPSKLDRGPGQAGRGRQR